MGKQWAACGCLLAFFASASLHDAPAQSLASAKPLAVTPVQDETGRLNNGATLRALRAALAERLRTDGMSVPTGLFASPATDVRPLLLQCPGPANPAALPPTADADGCLGTVTVLDHTTGRVAFQAVARTPAGGDIPHLAAAMADAVVRGLRPPSMQTRVSAEDISATGMPVQHLGDARFRIGGRLIDLSAVQYTHDPAVDPDVPQATNITLSGIVPPRLDSAGRPYANITLYQIDPPLTGLASREPGIDRGTDFRDPANLVKAAYSNYMSPLLTDDVAPVRVNSHPIGHFVVKVEVPGYPILLTGMTTIARADTELVDLTLGRQLGVGGVLLTPQPGRLNSAAEVARELALRQRRLRVVDGLYFHRVNGRNVGPEYIFDDGRVVFARIRLPLRNATDALAYFVEFLYRGEQNRFGSLLNSPFKGTGAGCAAFALSWLQAAGVIPLITEPAARPRPDAAGPRGASGFWREVRATVHIPWRDIGCDERLGAAGIYPAQLAVYDMLFHGETDAFIRNASEGLAEHIRASYGAVPATLFQLGALTPLRDLVINGRRRDVGDHGDYTWSGPGIDVPYWDNARFAAWIRREWQRGPRNPRITLAREGRFIGVAIDAMQAERQGAPFFAAADRRNALRAAGGVPAASCQAVFARGLE